MAKIVKRIGEHIIELDHDMFGTKKIILDNKEILRTGSWKKDEEIIKIDNKDYKVRFFNNWSTFLLPCADVEITEI